MKHRFAAAIVIVAALAFALGSGSSPVADSGRPSASALAADPGPEADRGSWRAELMGGNAESCARTAASSMIDEDLVRQLFVVGEQTTGTDVHEDHSAVGGFILMGRSAAGIEATAQIVDRLRRFGKFPGVRPFVAVDQEGGKVQVLSGPGFSSIPDAEQQGRWPAERLQQSATQWGTELAAAGVMWNLAPVADVVEQDLVRKNEPIGIPRRSFSTDPSIVFASAGAVSRGLNQAAVLPTLKHFPGLGAVVGNTDYKAGVVDRTTDSSSPSVEIYRKLLASGPQTSVMISTAAYAKLDGNVPAAFSRPIITDLLRKQIGFHGLVVSDDLAAAEQVSGVPLSDRGARFIDAGGDVVIGVDRKSTTKMIDGAVRKASTDREFAGKVHISADRVLTMKATLGLLDCAAITK